MRHVFTVVLGPLPDFGWLAAPLQRHESIDYEIRKGDRRNMSRTVRSSPHWLTSPETIDHARETTTARTLRRAVKNAILCRDGDRLTGCSMPVSDGRDGHSGYHEGLQPDDRRWAKRAAAKIRRRRGQREVRRMLEELGHDDPWSWMDELVCGSQLDGDWLDEADPWDYDDSPIDEWDNPYYSSDHDDFGMYDLVHHMSEEQEFGLDHTSDGYSCMWTVQQFDMRTGRWTTTGYERLTLIGAHRRLRELDKNSHGLLYRISLS